MASFFSAVFGAFSVFNDRKAEKDRIQGYGGVMKNIQQLVIAGSHCNQLPLYMGCTLKLLCYLSLLVLKLHRRAARDDGNIVVYAEI